MKKKDVAFTVKDEKELLELTASPGETGCQEEHERPQRDGSWQGGYQKYDDTFKPRISAGSSTFTQN